MGHDGSPGADERLNLSHNTEGRENVTNLRGASK